jgi:hypothetical protein
MFALVSGFAATSFGQYPGRITKTDKSTPVLRSIAVLEWTGAPGKPSASRLVPVAVFDGEQLNDGTIYLTRPEPLALADGVEYELQAAGKPMGLFDVSAAGEINGTWEGFGAWRPLTAAQAAKASAAFNTSTLYGGSRNDADNDQPVLHRKHPKEADSDESGNSTSKTADSSAKSGSDSASGGKASSEPADPDRPTLKRKAGSDSSSSSNSTSSSSSSGSGSDNVDPDRPTLHRNRHAADDEMAGSSTVAPDPDRPRLKRGKPAGMGDLEAPKLTGFPPTMQQAVAVSDASNHPEHPWKYTWANMDDEFKMKTALEAIARTALGLDPQTAPAKPVKKTAQTKTTQSTTRAKKAAAAPVEPPEPVELADETFRVFELAYGSNATLVLTASAPLPTMLHSTNDSTDDTAGNAAGKAAGSADDSDEPPPPVIKRGKPTSNTSATTKPAVPAAKATTLTKTATPVTPAPQKFVTLVAQPDLYGGIIVLFKSVTDAAHLDDRPRMRLVDAVDAMADNRGELLFELRGKTQRQFALFRVLRGSAEQLFATSAIQ